jgi:hypothetical protein
VVSAAARDDFALQLVRSLEARSGKRRDAIFLNISELHQTHRGHDWCD